MIDGVLGMAYGVSATTFLLTLGVPPAMASASTHAAECVTTGLSALSHLRFGNVDKRLVRALLIPGVLGGIAGAYILVSIPGDRMKPYTAAYLLIMGIVILSKAWKRIAHREVTTHLVPLGLAGGFFDAIGGGGWGPIPTGTPLARANEPRSARGRGAALRHRLGELRRVLRDRGDFGHVLRHDRLHVLAGDRRTRDRR